METGTAFAGADLWLPVHHPGRVFFLRTIQIFLEL